MRSHTRYCWLLCAALLPPLVSQASLQTPSLDAQLLEAAGNGDVKAVAELLDKGANIDAENWRGATSLCSAAEHGHVDVVKLLIDRGANIDARDLEWGRTPLINVTVPPSDQKHAHAEAAIMKILLDKGAGSDGESLRAYIQRGRRNPALYDTVKTIVSRGRVFQSYLNTALADARHAKLPDLVDFLIRAGAKDPTPIDSPGAPERLNLVAGVYRSASGQELILRAAFFAGDINPEEAAARQGVSARTVTYQHILLERAGRPKLSLSPIDLSVFRAHDMKTVVRLKGDVLPPADVTLRENGRVEVFTRTGDIPPPTMTRASAPPTKTASSELSTVSPPSAVAKMPLTREWPMFRGPNSSGVMDGANPPTTWDLEKGINIKWKTRIPGLAHASPVVWGSRVFIATAVPVGDAKPFFRSGEGSASTAESANRSTKDELPHAWRVYALDKRTGKILWNVAAREGVPRSPRHVNESQANSTPATDGKHVVVFFGSEGLYCFDVDGRLLWKKDLGVLKSGYVMDPTYEWNTASSPIIYKNLVILQVDLIEDSFIAAYDIRTGKEIWVTQRSDEIPSWATPFIYEGPERTELVTLASIFARGYDPNTGKELWRLGRHATHATPTPIAGNGLIFLTSGSGNTIQPIYALRPGAQGNITLGDDDTSNEFIAWSKHRGGAFLSTPIFYDGLLYVCGGEGIFAAYKPDTGERVYQVRLPPNNYTASGVAADGKLYFSNVDGEVVVVKAGPKFEQLAVNSLGEVIQASPAISQGMIIFRTQHHVVAVGEPVPGSK